MKKRRLLALILACALAVGLAPVRARASGTMGKVETSQTIAAGGRHSLAIKNDDTLWAWGANNAGQLGDGTSTGRRTPVKVMDNVAAVSAGGNHTLAIKTDGTLWAWGANDAGQLGDGTTENRYTPVKVMDNVATASAGPSSTLVITIDNALWAWGNNQHGHLGDGTTTEHHKPVKVMDGIIGVQTDGATTIALKEDHSLLVWGRNKGSACNVENVISAYTELNANYAVSADGGLWQHHNSQKQAWKLLDNVVTCSISNYASFALKEDGSLWAWGNNINGQITYDTSIARAHSPFYSKDYMTPLQVMSDVVGVDSSLGHTLAIKSDGSLWAWGRNKSGQVGPLADDYIKQRGGDIIQATPAKVLDNVKLPGSTSGVTQTTLTEKNYPGVPEVVNPSSWAEGEVNSARDNGLIPESLDGNYTGNITRLEFCKLAMALVKSMDGMDKLLTEPPILDGVSQGASFTDTDDRDVEILCDSGIVKGYGGGRFGPDALITREEAAVMLHRLGKLWNWRVADERLNFTDKGQISSWAKESVAFVSNFTYNGKAIMGGTGGGKFSPKTYYTREQAFITFQRLHGAMTTTGKSSALATPESVQDGYSLLGTQMPVSTVDGLDCNFVSSGMYVDSYKAEPTGDSSYRVAMNVYNTTAIYGSVDVYDANGNYLRSERVDKFEVLPTGIKNTFKEGLALIKDAFEGELLTYRQDSYSKKTSLEIVVPEGGWIVLSNNMTQSVGAYIYNMADIIISGVSTASDVVKLAEKDYSEVSKSFGDTFIEELQKKTADFVTGDGVPKIIETINTNFTIVNVTQFYDQLANGFWSQIKDMGVDMQKVSQKCQEKLATSVPISALESVVKKLGGPAGMALDMGFKSFKVGNLTVQANHMVKAWECPSVIISYPLSQG